MNLFKITNTNKINGYAKRKSDIALKIIIVMIVILFSVLIFQNKGKDDLISLIVILLFVAILFYFLFLQLKKLMWFLGKNITYTLMEDALIIKQSLDNELEMGFIPRYLYNSGKRKGGYRDVSIKYNKMKTIAKNNKGDLILKTTSFGLGKIIIPRELENLRELENQLRTKMK